MQLPPILIALVLKHKCPGAIYRRRIGRPKLYEFKIIN